MSVGVLGILFRRLLNESKNSHIFLGWHQPSDSQNKFRTNLTCSPTPSLCSDFCEYANNIFIIIYQCRCFTFGIGLDKLMNVLEDVFVWAPWVLFNFYLKQKQRFAGWNFTKNYNLISLHGRILSRYSEINKFVI